jgi:hypothetical protein
MFVDDEHLEFVLVPTELEISMSYLLRDGIVEMRVPTNEASVLRVPSFREYWLTELGEEVIVRFAEGRLVG